MQAQVCKDTPDSEHCSASAGFSLGWQIIHINDEIILDHSGSDPEFKTLALLVPNRKIGIVVFTSGPDIDNRLIQKVVSVLYPNPVYLNTQR